MALVVPRSSLSWSRLLAAALASSLALLLAVPASLAGPAKGATKGPPLSASGVPGAPSASGVPAAGAAAASGSGAVALGVPVGAGVPSPFGVPAASSRPFVLGAGATRPPPMGYAPDPEPLVTTRKWVYEIVYHEGALFSPTPAVRVKPRPTETPRHMGRFAIELFVGRTLIERVRFDLPLLNGDPFTGDPRRPYNAPPDFEKKARVQAFIEVPDSERATYAILVDRATGRRVRLYWPPVDAPVVPAPRPAASVAPALAASVVPASKPAASGSVRQ